MPCRLKIAIADDERDTREYLAEYLAHLGHEIMMAGDGRDLVEICHIFRPDLIVTDYAMPGLDGFSAAAEVNRERSVPVILISGRQDAEAAALSAPYVIGFLTKPVKSADLKMAIELIACGS